MLQQLDTIKNLQNSLRVLFLRPNENGNLVVSNNLYYREFIDLLTKAVNSLNNSNIKSNEANFCDYINLIADKYGTIETAFEKIILQVSFELLIEQGFIKNNDYKNGEFFYRQLENIFVNLTEICQKICVDYQEQLSLKSLQILKELRALNLSDIKEKIKGFDPFINCNTFNYVDKSFVPIKLGKIRDSEQFFGFSSVKNIFAEHFGEFAQGKNNVPLLISSLPGHGKTQMVISYTLKYDNLTLILANPENMQTELPEVLHKLSLRSDRKFVLFFDDIVPEEIDWYFFRTHIGGSFALPENVLIVIASNYHFPPSILSRGRSVLFPIFDEIRCMEMVEEFLINMRLKHPKQNLISMIAADYTEHFGQKRFSELSPRTLMRYLKIYEQDFNKRRTMLNLSLGDFISKPDAMLFYEFNIELMRNLYGNEFIENLLKERMRKMENGA